MVFKMNNSIRRTLLPLIKLVWLTLLVAANIACSKGQAQEVETVRKSDMNIYDTKALTGDKEHFEEILNDGTVKIERIISFGHPTPKGEWYDQEQREWVALIEGTATLLFKDGTTVELTKGDHIIIEPHQVHRVENVSDDAIWLAVFI